MSQPSLYIHGTEPSEQQRLQVMNRILNEPSLRELGIQPGTSILEVGSGLGEFARAMARTAGRTVIAVERSGEQIATAQRLAAVALEEGAVDMREGDALDLPLKGDEWSSFDLVHSRFLLEHLRDPLAAVRQMVKAARIGGRIVVEDDDHDVLRLWPEPPGARELWQAYMRSYERLGNDPFIGRRLVELLHDAGATPVRSTQIFFGACAGAEDFPFLMENMIGLLRSAIDHIVDLRLMDRRYALSAIEQLQLWSRRPDAAFWYSMAYAEGIRRS